MPPTLLHKAGFVYVDFIGVISSVATRQVPLKWKPFLCNGGFQFAIKEGFCYAATIDCEEFGKLYNVTLAKKINLVYNIEVDF